MLPETSNRSASRLALFRLAKRDNCLPPSFLLDDEILGDEITHCLPEGSTQDGHEHESRSSMKRVGPGSVEDSGSLRLRAAQRVRGILLKRLSNSASESISVRDVEASVLTEQLDFRSERQTSFSLSPGVWTFTEGNRQNFSCRACIHTTTDATTKVPRHFCLLFEG